MRRWNDQVTYQDNTSPILNLCDALQQSKVHDSKVHKLEGAGPPFRTEREKSGATGLYDFSRLSPHCALFIRAQLLLLP